MKLTNQQLGFFGAAILGISTFLPLFSVPIIGSVSYIQGDGIFLLAGAGVAAALIFYKKAKWNWLIGIGSLLMVSNALFTGLQVTGDSRFVGIQIGFVGLYAGAVMILLSASRDPEARFEAPKPINFGDGTLKLPLAIYWVGLGICLFTPTAIVITRTITSGKDLLVFAALWLLSGTLGGLLYLVLMVISPVLLAKGRTVIVPSIHLASAVWFFFLDEAFWAGSSKSLWLDAAPLLAIYPILPLIGAVFVSAGVASIARKRKSQAKEAQAGE